MDNVLGRPLFKLASGSSSLGKMQQQLIAAGYDVSKLDPTRIISLYDYVFGSGEGKDYAPAVSTYKAQGGPVKLAEGESVPRYQTGPSTLGKVFSRFMNPPNENVINSIRKQAKSYYFNALLPSKDGTGSYTMKQMEAADKKANELAEMDVMAYLENFKSVDPMKKAKSENPILNYRDTYSEDDEGGFPTDVIVDEMKFHRAILNSPEFEDKMIDMDALKKKMFSLDAPTYQYLLNLPKKEQDRLVKKYIARDTEFDIERAEDTASDYMKRRYGMAQGGMPNTTENVGIMDGVGIGAEALMAQEQAIDQAQDIGGLMSAIRGKPINEEEARGELAELVGPEDAQATPDSVLALVQPVMELSKGQGIAQFVEEAEMPETQTMAQGGSVQRYQTGGTEDYRGFSIPDLRAAYESQYPVVQEIIGGPRDRSGLRSDILFQIAAGGLEMARARKPGETSDPFSIFSESFKQPLLNIGALAREERKTGEVEEKQLKGTALGMAQDVITGKKAEVDADIAYQAELAKAEREQEERAEDMMTDNQVFFDNNEKKNVVLSKRDIVDLKKTYGAGGFAEMFSPKTDIKLGSFEVVERGTGERPELAPTGRMDLAEIDGRYFYRDAESNELVPLPGNITVSAAVSSQATAKGTDILEKTPGTAYNEALGGVTQLATGLTYLDDIYQSSEAKGSQLGYVAKLKKIGQSIVSIGEDFGFNLNPIYEDLLSATQDDNFNEQVSASLAQLEKDIYDLNLKRESGETLTETEQQALDDEGAMRAFLSGNTYIGRDENKNLVIKEVPKSYIDEALFQNAVKINSLIYAVARARKPTGRLNVDDIKNASAAIDIWKGGERGVQAALRAVRKELADAGVAEVKKLIQMDPARALYDDTMANFGITEKQFNDYKDTFVSQVNKFGKEGVELDKLPKIGGIYGGGFDSPLVSGFELPATGNDNTESMTNWINSVRGGGNF